MSFSLELSTSDLILAVGVKLWSQLVKERKIQELEESHLLASTVLRLLSANPDQPLPGVVAEEDESEAVYHRAEDNQNDDDDDKMEETDLDDMFSVISSSDQLDDQIREVAEESQKVDPPTPDAVNLETVENDGDLEDQKTVKTEDSLSAGFLSKISGAMKRKKKEKYECEHCHCRFFTLFVLSQHIKKEHTKDWEEFDTKHRTFACKFCPEKYYSERSLGEHMTLNHKQHARCKICGLVLYSPEKLRQHEERQSA